MDLLILSTYAAIVIAAFKLFRVPVNGYTVTTAALIGVAILFSLLTLMNYNHPYTKVARFYAHTTPVVPQVRGHVIEVAVDGGQEVKKGEVLFRIDPTPYQNEVDTERARVAAAEQRAAELEPNLLAFEEAHNAAIAERDAAEDTYTRDKGLVANDALTESRFIQAKQAYFSALARASQAKAELSRAKLELESQIDGINTEVAEARAKLASAQFNLEQTTVRAPTDGTVLQVMLRPGMMAVPLPLKPVMIFQHKESPYFVASFLQNSAQRIKEGEEVEVILPAVPGRFFRGKVKDVGSIIAQGQLQPSGDLIAPELNTDEGRINVEVEFEEGELDGYQIIPGSTGHAAIYSDSMEQVAIMRRVLMRMKSWLNYVFSDGH